MTKYAVILFSILLVIPFYVQAQGTSINLGSLNIPQDRVPQWYSPEDIEALYLEARDWTEYDVTCSGGTCPSGKLPIPSGWGCGIVSTSDFSEMDCLVDNAPDNVILFIPPGTYSFGSGGGISIARSNIVIRGAGPENTILRSTSGTGTFVNQGRCHSGTSALAISLCQPTLESSPSNWVSGYSYGEYDLVLSDASGFSVGEWIRATMRSDVACEYIDMLDWIGNEAPAFGHIAKIVSINGNTITLDRPLRMDYDGSGCTEHQVYHYDLLEKVGLEDLRITSSVREGLVRYSGLSNSWVINTMMDHGSDRWFFISSSARIWVQGNHFDDLDNSIGYNTEGMLTHSSTDIFWENNICTTGRVCQENHVGAEGIVSSYNFFNLDQSICEKTFFNHGFYSRENLMEGNDMNCGLMIADGWWSRNGPRLTAFRNRMTADANLIPNKDIGGMITDYQCRADAPYVADQINIIGNTAGWFNSRPGCSSNPASCPDMDYNSINMWLEKNIYRDGFRLNTPEPTTNCGTGVGNCLGNNEGPLDTSPASWSSDVIPHSLYRNTIPSWWCEEACSWDDVHNSIGAWGDDFSGTLCKLPAQIRFEGGVCTPVGEAGCVTADDCIARECNTVSCDNEKCVYTPLQNGAGCSNGLFCDGQDTCQEGVCVSPGNPCPNDGFACTVETCDEGSDSCSTVVTDSICDDGNLCTADICDPMTSPLTGCLNNNNNNPCDDNEICTSNDVCSSGVCLGEIISVCQDNDGCCPPDCDPGSDNDCSHIVYLIESGSDSPYTDTLGRVWEPEHSSYGPGGIVDRGSVSILNTEDDRIYQTERWNLDGYNLSIPDGNYTVRLHFAETWYQTDETGDRVFDVDIEGSLIDNIDVFNETGSSNRALIKERNVTVTDGTLNIVFTREFDSTFGTMINGVEVLKIFSKQFHSADLDGNGCISLEELTYYADRWFVNSDDVSIVQLIRAIEKWKDECLN